MVKALRFAKNTRDIMRDSMVFLKVEGSRETGALLLLLAYTQVTYFHRRNFRKRKELTEYL